MNGIWGKGNYLRKLPSGTFIGGEFGFWTERWIPMLQMWILVFLRGKGLWKSKKTWWEKGRYSSKCNQPTKTGKRWKRFRWPNGETSEEHFLCPSAHWLLNKAELNVPGGTKIAWQASWPHISACRFTPRWKGSRPSVTSTPEICIFSWMVVSVYGKFPALWSTERNKLSRHEGSGWTINKPDPLRAKSYIIRNIQGTQLSSPFPP